MTKRKVLKPHQEEGVAYGVRRKRGYFYMYPRNGKTLTAKRTLDQIADYPVLIVTLRKVFYTWAKALLEEGIHGEEILEVDGTKEKRIKSLGKVFTEKRVKYVIINYQALVPCRALDVQYPWSAVIFDESYKLGGIETRWTEYALKASRHLRECPVFMLSGSPSSESKINLVPQFFVVDGCFMGYHSLGKYLHDYWKFNTFSRKWTTTKRHQKEIELYVQQEAYCTALDFCLKKYSTIEVGLNPAQERALEWAYKKCEDLEALAKILGKTSNIGKMLYIMYENAVCAGIDPETNTIISTAKQEATIQEYKKRPRQMLVISYRKEPIYTMVEMARAAGIRCAYITGDAECTSEVSKRIEKAFAQGKLDMVVAQVECVKYGIDFQTASTTIYLNNSMKFDDRVQSEERTSNIEKDGHVEIIDMVTTGGADFIILERLRDKETSARRTIDPAFDKHIKYRQGI